MTAKQTAKGFPVPWGLFAALGIYIVAVTAYFAYTYWTSPEYQASVAYGAAWNILGRDQGRHCGEDELLEAYRLLLETAQKMPLAKEPHEDLEHVAWLFEEHRWRLPAPLRSAADAQSALYARAVAERAPVMAVGAREFSPPKRAAAWSLVGVGLIIVFWAYLRYSSKRVRDSEHEANRLQLEKEVGERAAQRRPPRG